MDFHVERRVNATHQRTTDPEARLFRKGKGKEGKLVFMSHALMENRNGLLADFQVSPGRAARRRADAAGPGTGTMVPSQDRGWG